MGGAAVAIIGSVLSAASSGYNSKRTRDQAKRSEDKAEAQIAEQEALEADEARRLEEKQEDRQRAVMEEGRPSTFAAGGQGGLTGEASTKKKKLGQ